MPVTFVNAEGHMLRNPNNNSWNEEGKYTGKPVVPWTFADKNYTNSVISGTLQKALDKLVAAGVDATTLTVVPVGEAPKKKGDKPTPKPEPVEKIDDDDAEFEECDEWELFKKHGLNKKCMECVHCDKCGQAGCVQILRCPSWQKKAA